MVQPDNIRNAVEENLSTFHSIDLNSINQYCQNNSVGKMLPDAFYIHILALHTLDPWLQEYESLLVLVVSEVELVPYLKSSRQL